MQVTVSSAEKWVSIFHYWLLKLSLYGIVGEVHSFKETDYDIHYVCMYIHTYIYTYIHIYIYIYIYIFIYIWNNVLYTWYNIYYISYIWYNTYHILYIYLFIYMYMYMYINFLHFYCIIHDTKAGKNWYRLFTYIKYHYTYF